MDTSPTSEEFEIISAVRSDEILLNSYQNTWVNAATSSTAARLPTQFYMLGYHLDRMRVAAEAFGRDTTPLEGPQAFGALQSVLHDHLERKYNDRNYSLPLKVWWKLIPKNSAI